MKKSLFILFALFVLSMVFSSCERVAPNFVGVLMEHYGKNGKSDFSLQVGRVPTWQPGTELFQVPLWEQRADFGDRILHLKAADNTEFTSKPLYSYKIIKERAIDVVFDNKQLGSGDDFVKSLEDNILESKIYDIMKEESRKYSTDALMETRKLPDGSLISGSLEFENNVQEIIKKEFEARGLELITFSCQLEFTDAVKQKIDKRNEVNTNISVIDQQIAEQRKKNELAELKAKEDMIPLISAKQNGVLDAYLKVKFYEAWRETKTPLYGMTSLVKSVE